MRSCICILIFGVGFAPVAQGNLKVMKNTPAKVVSSKETFFEKNNFSPLKKTSHCLLSDKKVQYLENQYIIGYSFSPRYHAAMNMHPEIGIGVGFKKPQFTTGISGTVRFLKTRQPYAYYHLSDTFSTRYFVSLPFLFFMQKDILLRERNSLHISLAPGFEMLYLERQNATYVRSRASAISFLASFAIGYRYTKPNLQFYQASISTNYTHFSFGGMTNIPEQWFLGFRFSFGFLVKDEWAAKQNR